MNEDPKIKSMREEAEKLAALMRDPQPGLFTWADFVRERVEAINELWYGAASRKVPAE